MKIAGYRNGYFIDKNDRKKAIADIIELDSDFTIIGMGSPCRNSLRLT